MQELWTGLGLLGLYFILCASAALLLRRAVTVPDEIFRKLLHCILLGSLFVWIQVFSQWYLVSLTALLFAVLVYPLLCVAERLFKGYSQLLTERKSGELKTSLLLVFSMFAGVVSICWGVFGDKLLVPASIYAWGFGDAAAALMGKRFGKHKIRGRGLSGQKSWEGTLAMFTVSVLSVLAILLLRGGLDLGQCLLCALLTGAASAAVELYTPGGLDTISCPLAAMTVLLVLTKSGL